jgi:hypothetical protein
MNWNDMAIKLKEINQPKSRVFLNPPDGGGGLFEISKVQLMARHGDGELPWIILSSFGDQAVTGEALLKLIQHKVPSGSELYYGDRDNPE